MLLWLAGDNVSMILDNDTRSQPARNSRRTLLKYCACAWALPAVVVVTCFALDYTDTVGIGYGKRESWCVASFLLHTLGILLCK